MRRYLRGKSGAYTTGGVLVATLHLDEQTECWLACGTEKKRNENKWRNKPNNVPAQYSRYRASCIVNC